MFKQSTTSSNSYFLFRMANNTYNITVIGKVHPIQEPQKGYPVSGGPFG